MKIGILYSGGLDSYIMYRYAQIKYPDAEIKCVFYAHGQDAEEIEISKLPSFVDVRKIDWLGDKIKPQAKKSDPAAGAIYIPGRNLILASLIASQDLVDEVWLGTLADEDNVQATDKNERFRSRTSELLSYVLSPFVSTGVKVRFPFVEENWTKEDSVRWVLDNGATKEDLIENTISCWFQKGDKPCGECKQCLKRKLIFALMGFSEDYVIDPLDSPKQQELMIKFLNMRLDSSYATNADEDKTIDMIERVVFPKYLNQINNGKIELSETEKTLVETMFKVFEDRDIKLVIN